ncbi:abortive infection family protein [archaeon]|jgi:hypothetical protein|nr:abortive infection family protein [Anaerolineae bacterium]MBT3577647.1 abortive infection family protein [archaeon]MBT7191281.1 abortive infection family protein [Anaerolineae bacterium]MBT7991418.1 abortive infection family protein [Anaerolineae bacterium]
MSNLSSIEKLKLERLFEMDGGYVLEFSNRTFQEFILENIRVDIYDDKYAYASGSKANRLRAFWTEESNYLVSKLISSLLEYWKAQNLLNSHNTNQVEQELYDECKKITERLKQDSAVENIEALQSYSDKRSFSLLAKSIREGIQRNEPEKELDRLHTYVVKYVRLLCDKHGISYDKKVPLHSLFGGYVKHLKQRNLIEAEMTERILKSSISIMESFNKVRNNQSLAHDNSILNYHESLLIFNHVANLIKFIETIENVEEESEQDDNENDWDDIPF